MRSGLKMLVLNTSANLKVNAGAHFWGDAACVNILLSMFPLPNQQKNRQKRVVFAQKLSKKSRFQPKFSAIFLKFLDFPALAQASYRRYDRIIDIRK